MDRDCIAYEVEDHVAVVTLDRPDALNALDERLFGELVAIFDETDGDDAVRAVVVTGRGRAFCAGADLSAAGADTFTAEHSGFAGEGPDDVPRDGGGILTLRIFASRKPVIGAVNGAAVGLGATMTLPMDIRLASEEARFGFVFTRRGLVPDGCSSWFLPRVVGIGRAAEWIYTGRLVSAAEAREARLVRSVHPTGQLLDAALEVAHEIAEAAAPVSVALSRQLLWRMLGADHPMVAHRAESRGIAARGSGPDVREGIESFLAKRAVEFPMRVSDGLPDLFPGWVEPEFR